MNKIRLFRCWLMLASAFQGSACFASIENETNDLWFFVLVKSNNYSQNQEGDLTLLNYHFFSELFGEEPGRIKSATLQRMGGHEEPIAYVDRGETFYYEGDHFKTVDAVDVAHPNGKYRFNITLSSGEIVDATLDLSGPIGKTDIPAPIQIHFIQGGQKVAPNLVDPAQTLTVSWSPYSNGRSDPKGIVDDMIFVVFQDCNGERVFHTGLPFKEENYMTYLTKEVVIPAGRFEPGQTYSMFVEFPHVVDSVIANGVPGFASYATATYADIKTVGVNSKICPDEIPPLDTGQTDRMDVDVQ